MIFLQFTVARITNAVLSRNLFIVGLREKILKSWSQTHNDNVNVEVGVNVNPIHYSTQHLLDLLTSRGG